MRRVITVRAATRWLRGRIPAVSVSDNLRMSSGTVPGKHKFGSASAKMELRDWYHVCLSDSGIHLEVSPPGRIAWQADILWSDIVRICFKAEGGLQSDGWYIFAKQRPESYAVPVEAAGGETLLDEFLNRKLFDPELAIRAAGAIDELFCWPPVE